MDTSQSNTPPEPTAPPPPEQQVADTSPPELPRLSMKPIHIMLALIFSILLGVGGLFALQELINNKPDLPKIKTIPNHEQSDNGVPAADMQYRELTYHLPESWSVYGNPDLMFSFAYDKTVYHNPEGNEANLSLNSVACCSSVFFSVEQYDGPDLLPSLAADSGFVETENSYKQSYVISGKPAHFLYHADGSGSCSTGVIQINDTQALRIFSQLCTNTELEPILATIAIPGVSQRSCPKTEWVDCMPGPDAGERPECDSEYLDWALANCPGFRGAAL